MCKKIIFFIFFLGVCNVLLCQNRITLISLNTQSFQDENNIEGTEIIQNQNETNSYFVDSEGNTFFVLTELNQLIYYSNRNFTDNDLINKVSQSVYYFIDETLLNEQKTTRAVEIVGNEIRFVND